jgi:hypothetical protein
MIDLKAIAMPRTLSVLFALILTTLMAGCGEVVVFGHTVREGKTSTPEVKADSSAAPAENESASAGQTQSAPSGKVSTSTTPDVAAVIRHATVVRSVTLVLTPQAAIKTSDDARFNGDALLAEIKSELQARKLFDDTNVNADAATVSIDDYSMQRTSNVILFGKINSVGMLKGNIRIQDGRGTPLPTLRIEAESRISIPEDGDTPNPLGPLYRRFAVATADTLAGTVPAN